MSNTTSNDATWLIELLAITAIMARLFLSLSPETLFIIFKTLGP